MKGRQDGKSLLYFTRLIAPEVSVRYNLQKGPQINQLLQRFLDLVSGFTDPHLMDEHIVRPKYFLFKSKHKTYQKHAQHNSWHTSQWRELQAHECIHIFFPIAKDLATKKATSKSGPHHRRSTLIMWVLMPAEGRPPPNLMFPLPPVYTPHPLVNPTNQHQYMQRHK